MSLLVREEEGREGRGDEEEGEGEKRERTLLFIPHALFIPNASEGLEWTRALSRSPTWVVGCRDLIKLELSLLPPRVSISRNCGQKLELGLELRDSTMAGRCILIARLSDHS